MAGSLLEPISFERRLKYLLLRGIHRLLSAYPYEDSGRGLDPELSASIREKERGLVVAPSLIPQAGMGLFADRDYEAGEVVCTYIGTPLTFLQMLRTRDWTYMMDCGRNCQGRRVHLDARHQPRTKAAYVNHHFDRSRHNLFCDELPDEHKCLMMASRHIRQGEELYMDYGAKYWHVVTAPPPSDPYGAEREAPLSSGVPERQTSHEPA